MAKEDTVVALYEARFERNEQQLDRIEKKVGENTAILKNGLKDRMFSLEKIVEDALKPQPWWQKFLLKTGGTAVIISLFVGGIYLILRVMPANTLIQLLEALGGIV